MSATDPALRALLALVAACPHRGPVLPVSLQPECGCAELSGCRAGKGAGGKVALGDCLQCRAALGRDGPAPRPHGAATTVN